MTNNLLVTIGNALPELAKVAQGGKKNTNVYLGLVQDVQRGLQSNSLPWSEWVKLSKALPEVISALFG